MRILTEDVLKKQKNKNPVSQFPLLEQTKNKQYFTSCNYRNPPENKS